MSDAAPGPKSRKSRSRTKSINEWLDTVEEPSYSDIDFAIAATEAEMRAEESQTSIQLSMAAIALALSTVAFALEATLLAVLMLAPAAGSLILTLLSMGANRARLQLLLRLYNVRHRPKPRRSWRFWSR